jgi:hypothetical protein
LCFFMEPAVSPNMREVFGAAQEMHRRCTGDAPHEGKGSFSAHVEHVAATGASAKSAAAPQHLAVKGQARDLSARRACGRGTVEG